MWSETAGVTQRKTVWAPSWAFLLWRNIGRIYCKTLSGLSGTLVLISLWWITGLEFPVSANWLTIRKSKELDGKVQPDCKGCIKTQSAVNRSRHSFYQIDPERREVKLQDLVWVDKYHGLFVPPCAENDQITCSMWAGGYQQSRKDRL